jgi:tripartite-type tricarboxylate transporter receptor subunit TctC
MVWRVFAIFASFLISAGAATAPAAAQSSAEQFYRGNTLRMISGAGNASGYTIWTRFIGQFLGRHIPGNPTVIAETMAGAGGMIATNYIYKVAPKDGREIASVARETPSLSMLNSPGVQWDSLKFNWLGTPTSDINLCIVGANSAIKTVQDLYTHAATMGTDGVGSGMHIFPVALDEILGMKMKTIDGYADSGVAMLAVDRGEIDGVCQSAETLLLARGDEIKSGKVRVILQAGLKASPRFADVPFVLDLAKTEEQKQELRFLYASQAFGRPFVAPPGVPQDRVAALQTAFMDTFKDPDFLAGAKTQGYTINPISGPDMAAMVQELGKTPKDVIEKVAALTIPPGSR